MDWLNFGLFFISVTSLNNLYDLEECMKLPVEIAQNENHCDVSSFTYRLRTELGVVDQWDLFAQNLMAKTTLSANACLQILKIIKFTNEMVPKMSLLTRVIRAGAVDLFFFTFVFGLSVISFAMLAIPFLLCLYLAINVPCHPLRSPSRCEGDGK